MLLKFPKIRDIHSAIVRLKNRYNYAGRDDSGEPIFTSLDAPSQKYFGVVKMHGSNSSIVFDNAECIKDLITQSRRRIINPSSDNHGFATFVYNLEERFIDEFCNWLESEDSTFNFSGIEKVTLFGEWVGRGVQGGVGLSNVKKSFIVFGMRVDDGEDRTYIPPHMIWPFPDFFKENRIFLITEVSDLYEFEINPQRYKEVKKEIYSIVEQIEEVCPVASYFDSEGGGEGLVCYPADFDLYQDTQTWFKAKGASHKAVRKSKKVEISLEKQTRIEEFVRRMVTENRLKQGLYIFEEDNIAQVRENVGTFIKWMINDVVDEGQASLEELNLSRKDVGSSIALVSRKWYFRTIEGE